MHTGLISFESGIANKRPGKEVSPKPYLRVIRTKDSVILEYDMGKQESIRIYCRRETEENFTLLTETSQSPFADTRSNLNEYSETREYKAVFSKNDKPVGEEDLIKIKTKGRFRFF